MLPLVFNATLVARGGEVSSGDNREYLMFQPTDASGTGDAVAGNPIKILVDDVLQQSLFTVGTIYTFSIS